MANINVSVHLTYPQWDSEAKHLVTGLGGEPPETKISYKYKY